MGGKKPIKSQDVVDLLFDARAALRHPTNMPKDLNQARSMMRYNEDVVAIFMKKLAEKKRILDEAQSMYNGLCANVEKVNTELTGIKMERFKMESLLQESEIRVKVFEKREREFREEAARMRESIKEAEIRQREELAARDAYNKGFLMKVVEMAEDYRRLKANCDKKTVSESFHGLRAADEQLASEIKKMNEEMGLEEGDHHVSLVTPDPVVEDTLNDIRELQRLLEHDVKSAELNNAQLQAQIDQMEALKTALGIEVDAMREIMEK